MNSEEYWSTVMAQIRPNAAKPIGECFTAKMDDDPKHNAKETQAFLKALQ